MRFVTNANDAGRRDGDESDNDDNDSSSSSSGYSTSSSSSSLSSSSSRSGSFLPSLPFLRKRKSGSNASSGRQRTQHQDNEEDAKNNDDHYRNKKSSGSSAATATSSNIHALWLRRRQCLYGVFVRQRQQHQHWSTWCFLASFCIWLWVHCMNTMLGWSVIRVAPQPVWQASPRDLPFVQAVQSRMMHLRDGNAHASISKPQGNFWDTAPAPHHKRKDMEDMPDGCAFIHPWQTTSFPSCNVLHEIDLHEHLKLVKQNQEEKEYFVSDGMWRHVFSIQPQQDGISVVMKLMKPEHDSDDRNLDRHRRDALAMERSTASPNVVDIYGYCGNTIVTEQAEMDLDTYLKTYSKNITLEEQLRIALEAARGLATLHALDIIHADLQTKQYLVVRSTTTTTTMTVKVNDFNRCRFLPRRNDTMALSTTGNSTASTKNVLPPICPIRIPSAPGSWRSPEEYSEKPLDHAMDVYSLGNVLHHILMGNRPFAGMGTTRLKANVRNGVHPDIRLPDNADPRARRLAVLIQLCLQLDIDKRISAQDLVRELELLQQQQQQQQVGEEVLEHTASDVSAT